MGNAIYKKQGIQSEQTAWYHKTYLTFSDLLAAVRKQIGDTFLLIESYSFYPIFAHSIFKLMQNC